MLKLFTNNWPAKLACLLIATGLWVYVASGESRADNFPGNISLEVRNNPENLVAIKDVNSVEIRIVTERSNWNKLSSDSFKAYINLSGYNEGTNEVPVTVETGIAGVQIVEIKPTRILVRLEPVISKAVPVEIKIEGSAGEGLVSGETSFEPSEVTVSGAKSIVNEAVKAIATVRLDGEEQKVEKTLSLVVYNGENQIVEGVDCNPSEVAITLPIIKGASTKTVGIKVKTEGRPKSGYWISEISTEPDTTVITGPTGSLKDVNYVETEKVTVDGLDSERTQTVRLSPPSGISLVGDSSSEIKITIKLSTISTEKEVIASFNYLNLANNLKISSIDPQSIKIIASGPVNKINELTTNLTNVEFDLKDYKVSGTYSLDISKNMIKVPDGIEAVSFVPSAVRITIDNK